MILCGLVNDQIISILVCFSVFSHRSFVVVCCACKSTNNLMSRKENRAFLLINILRTNIYYLYWVKWMDIHTSSWMKQVCTKVKSFMHFTHVHFYMSSYYTYIYTYIPMHEQYRANKSDVVTVLHTKKEQIGFFWKRNKPSFSYHTPVQYSKVVWVGKLCVHPSNSRFTHRTRKAYNSVCSKLHGCW